MNGKNRSLSQQTQPFFKETKLIMPHSVRSLIAVSYRSRIIGPLALGYTINPEESWELRLMCQTSIQFLLNAWRSCFYHFNNLWQRTSGLNPYR